jgi:ATP-dependent exoDNAse (exonuclease V) alpha subunit
MITYNSEQLEAINSCIDFINKGNSNEYFLIEGKAGTGKTTVIKEVIKKYRNKRIIAGALSHKAKYVIKESVEKDGINWVNYSSIAGMLNLQLDLETGIFKKVYKSNPNKDGLDSYDIIIIDEASMVNEETIELLFKEKKKSAKVIFLGDIGQLPPIRTKSNPYYKDWNEKDLGKNSPVFETTNKVKLLTRVRQGEESPILPFADFFWENSISDNPIKNPANIKYRNTEINKKGALIFINETKELFKNLLNVFDIAIKNNKPNLIKFVTYKNDTRNLINKYIHANFFGANCKTFEKGELIIFNENYGDIENSSEFQIIERYNEFTDKRDGLKLYCIDVLLDNKLHQLVLLHPDSKKDHDNYVRSKFNTAFDIKKQIDKLDKDKSDYIGLKNTLSKQYKTELENAWAEKNRFPNIDYAYCLSSHRSQGSTYDIVVVHEQDIMNVKPITNKEKSQSIYTAITRAKNISVIISSDKVYNNDIEISNIDILEINNNIENNKNDLRSITVLPS